MIVVSALISFFMGVFAQDLIDPLGSSTPQDRIQAQERILRLGSKALPLLRANLDHRDPEFALRCWEILDELLPRWESHDVRAKIVHKDLWDRSLIIDLDLEAEVEGSVDLCQDTANKIGYSSIGWARVDRRLIGTHLVRIQPVLGGPRMQLGDFALAKVTVWTTYEDRLAWQSRRLLQPKPELPIVLQGRLALVNLDAKTLATDLRQRDGIVQGAIVEIRRADRILGHAIVTDVQNWGSWLRTTAGTSLSDLQKGDQVMWLIPE